MRSLILCGLFALAQCAPSTSGQAAVHQRAALPDLPPDTVVALRKLAKSIKGPHEIKADWTGTSNICDWKGVTCDKSIHTGKEIVSTLDFTDFHLKGDFKLDGFLDKLTDLAEVDLGSNSFTGTVPDYGRLKDLTILDVHDNKLSGPFPTSSVQLAHLVSIDIRFNKFHGELPSKVFENERLNMLFANNNQLSGKLPSNIGNFNGVVLVLANNAFEGAIPSTLVNAKRLDQIILLGNKLTGTLPTGFDKMNLTVFDVSNNQLEGPVPESLCTMKYAAVLNLTGNNFDKALGKGCTKALKAGILLI